jgi:hypothetical protein
MSHCVEHHQFLTGREVKKEDNGRGGDGEGLGKEMSIHPSCFGEGMTSALNNRPEE